jgi:molybdopterin adenylyltransferase
LGRIKSINIGPKRGGAKRPAEKALLVAGWGLQGDGHAAPGDKQVSLLAWESALGMRNAGAEVDCGSFGENITTEGVALKELKRGDRLRVGDRVLLEVTVIGKECPEPCSIFRQVGFCIMPSEGVFCRVLEGGWIKAGDPIFSL